MRDIEAKRQRVLEAYAGDKWRKKVLAMSESQIIAIFFRLQREGKI